MASPFTVGGDVVQDGLSGLTPPNAAVLANSGDDAGNADSATVNGVPLAANGEVHDQPWLSYTAKPPSKATRKRKLQRPQRSRRPESPQANPSDGVGSADLPLIDSADRGHQDHVQDATPAEGRSTPSLLEDNPTNSGEKPVRPIAHSPSLGGRSARIRKPPKTFVEEMDEMYSIATQRRRRRPESSAAEQSKSQVTPKVVGKAQVVVETLESAQQAAIGDDTAGDGAEETNHVYSEEHVTFVSSDSDLQKASAPSTSDVNNVQKANPKPLNEMLVKLRPRDPPKPVKTLTPKPRHPTSMKRSHPANDPQTSVRAGSTEQALHPAKKRKKHGPSQGADPTVPANTTSPNTAITPGRSIHSVLPENVQFGDLIWGKMRGFDWWPGLVVSAEQASLYRAIPAPSLSPTGNQAWVHWFGDRQFSPIVHSRLAMLSTFRPMLLNTKKPKNMYRKALFEALEMAAFRARKEFPDQWLASGQTDEGKPTITIEDERLLDIFCGTSRQRHLLHWALNRFEPGGAESLSPVHTEESGGYVELDPIVTSLPLHTSPLPSVPATPTSQVVVATPMVSEPSPSLAARQLAFPRPTQQMIESDTRPGSRQQLERFTAVSENDHNLLKVCVCCAGTLNISQEHPLIVGGICQMCIPKFIECAYCYDEDGSQTFCTICADGKEVYLCDSPGCARAYCPLCLEKLCGPTIHAKVNKAESWLCFMCQPEQESGLLKVQADWHSRLVRLMASDNLQQYRIDPPPLPPPLSDRRPLRVLALFDGIGTGMLVLRELGLEVEKYVSSEIDTEAVRVARRHFPEITHVGDIESITRAQIAEWGPFDLVFGGSPCNDLSMANPSRRGIYEGTGRLFFDYHRLLELARPSPLENRPFFWLFENVVSMRNVDKMTISRFLECNPTVVDAKDVSPAHRPRFFWGNLPGMDRTIVPWPGDTLLLQDCIEPHCNRKAKFAKLRTITTKSNSIRQTKLNLFPIHVEADPACGDTGGDDGLWTTEMERIFGFPSHYTDIGNLSRVSRQRLLGRAWSVPVVRHLLAPLKDYFKVSSNSN